MSLCYNIYEGRKNMNNRKIKKLLKGSKSCIISTDNGSAVVGFSPVVLNNFTILVMQLRNDFTQEELERAFKRAFMEPAEFLNELIEMAKELDGKLKGNFEEKKPKEKTTKKQAKKTTEKESK